MDPASLRIISLTDAVIRKYYALSRPTPEFEESIASLINEIQNFLSELFNEQIRLDVFGSLKSGFGSLDSDVDVCLRFDRFEKAPKKCKEKDVISQVSRHLLHELHFVKSTRAVLSTKVPVVKCGIQWPSKISMDISYYNTLALENTRLLATYCAWEPERLPQLGLWVKKWAKQGGICNSRRKYPSSYGCILLLVHYLQKCDPPVLPHLQEDYVQAEKLHSSGWNTYFYPIVESNWSRNRKSVGELFLGFLDYYATVFDFKEMVVQIRQKQPMKKVEKRKKHENWIGHGSVLAIEDPFILERNLCGGLTENNFERIRTYFKRSAYTWKEAIGSLDVRASNPNFKRQLDAVLEKCHVAEMKNQMPARNPGKQNINRKNVTSAKEQVNERPEQKKVLLEHSKKTPQENIERNGSIHLQKKPARSQTHDGSVQNSQLKQQQTKKASSETREFTPQSNAIRATLPKWRTCHVAEVENQLHTMNLGKENVPRPLMDIPVQPMWPRSANRSNLGKEDITALRKKEVNQGTRQNSAAEFSVQRQVSLEQLKKKTKQEKTRYFEVNRRALQQKKPTPLLSLNGPLTNPVPQLPQQQQQEKKKPHQDSSIRRERRRVRREASSSNSTPAAPRTASTQYLPSHPHFTPYF